MAADEEDDTERARRPAGKKSAKDAGAGGSAGRTGDEAPEQHVSAPRAMRYAVEQLQQLLGRVPESVSAVKPTEDGWEAVVEVLELERIPETTSVMASYRVTLDKEGELVAYERTRRYTRGQIDPRA